MEAGGDNVGKKNAVDDYLPKPGGNYVVSLRDEEVLILTDTENNKTLIYKGNVYIEDNPFGTVVFFRCEKSNCFSWGVIVENNFYVSAKHLHSEVNIITAELHVFANILQQASKNQPYRPLKSIFSEEIEKRPCLQGIIFKLTEPFKKEMHRARRIVVESPYKLPVIVLDIKHGVSSSHILSLLQQEINNEVSKSFSEEFRLQLIKEKMSSENILRIINKMTRSYHSGASSDISGISSQNSETSQNAGISSELAGSSSQLSSCPQDQRPRSSQHPGALSHNSPSSKTFNTIKSSYVQMHYDNLRPQLKGLYNSRRRNITSRSESRNLVKHNSTSKSANRKNDTEERDSSADRLKMIISKQVCEIPPESLKKSKNIHLLPSLVQSKFEEYNRKKLSQSGNSSSSHTNSKKNVGSQIKSDEILAPQNVQKDLNDNVLVNFDSHPNSSREECTESLMNNPQNVAQNTEERVSANNFEHIFQNNNSIQRRSEPSVNIQQNSNFKNNNVPYNFKPEYTHTFDLNNRASHVGNGARYYSPLDNPQIVNRNCLDKSTNHPITNQPFINELGNIPREYFGKSVRDESCLPKINISELRDKMSEATVENPPTFCANVYNTKQPTVVQLPLNGDFRRDLSNSVDIPTRDFFNEVYNTVHPPCVPNPWAPLNLNNGLNPTPSNSQNLNFSDNGLDMSHNDFSETACSSAKNNMKRAHPTENSEELDFKNLQTETFFTNTSIWSNNRTDISWPKQYDIQNPNINSVPKSGDDQNPQPSKESDSFENSKNNQPLVDVDNSENIKINTVKPHATTNNFHDEINSCNVGPKIRNIHNKNEGEKENANESQMKANKLSRKPAGDFKKTNNENEFTYARGLYRNIKVDKERSEENHRNVAPPTFQSTVNEISQRDDDDDVFIGIDKEDVTEILRK